MAHSSFVIIHPREEYCKLGIFTQIRKTLQKRNQREVIREIVRDKKNLAGIRVTLTHTHTQIARQMQAVLYTPDVAHGIKQEQRLGLHG